jgi:hypothetical protein
LSALICLLTLALEVARGPLELPAIAIWATRKTSSAAAIARS